MTDVWLTRHRVFGGWQDAVAAAGLDAELATAPPKWDKQRVLDAIRARAAQGLPLTAVSKADPRLSAAAYRYYGRWAKAVAAAGLAQPASDSGMTE